MQIIKIPDMPLRINFIINGGWADDLQTGIAIPDSGIKLYEQLENSLKSFESG